MSARDVRTDGQVGAMAASTLDDHAFNAAHAFRHVRVWAIAALLIGCLAGCVRRDGINTACEWPGELPSELNLANAAHKQHLIDDAHFAEELGVRHGDAFRGRETVPDRGRRAAECTDRLMGLLTRLHSVTPEDVAAARRSRDWHWDAVTVFFPMLLLFSVVAGVLIDRVRRRFPAGERAASVMALLILSLFVAGIGVGVGDLWSWLAEIMRIGDSHLSYRAVRMPWVRHRLEIFAIGVVVFWIIAWLAYRSDTADTNADGA